MRIQPGVITQRMADELNDFIQRVENFLGLRVVAPLHLSNPTGRPILRSPGAPIPVRITGKLRAAGSTETDPYPIPDCAYSWTSIRPNLTNCDADAAEGTATGTIDQVPLIAIDGNTSIATGAEVIAFLAPSGDHYIFSPGGTGSCANDEGNVGCIQIVTDVTCDPDLGFNVNKMNFWFPKCLGVKVWTPDNDAPCITCTDGDQEEVYGVILDDGEGGTTVLDPPEPDACV